jgi:hypothetical protein
MHTKSEAAQLLCPIAFSGDYRHNCAADVCMMWRWYDQSSVEASPDVAIGYCGLASDPRASIFRIAPLPTSPGPGEG